jgi:hypothetical protein
MAVASAIALATCAQLSFREEKVRSPSHSSWASRHSTRPPVRVPEAVRRTTRRLGASSRNGSCPSWRTTSRRNSAAVGHSGSAGSVAKSRDTKTCSSARAGDVASSTRDDNVAAKIADSARGPGANAFTVGSEYAHARQDSYRGGRRDVESRFHDKNGRLATKQ